MLVRMMKDGQPKYVRADDIVDIGWADDDHECGACTVTYKDGGFAVVDGTPDEVFKALLNPPETLEKAPIEKVIQDWWTHAGDTPGLGLAEVRLVREVLEGIANRIGVRVRR